MTFIKTKKIKTTRLKNLFIATSSFAKKNSKLLLKLKQHNIKYTLNPLKRKLRKDETLKLARNYTHIIAGTENYDKSIIKNLIKLKMIFRLGSGIDNIDLNETRKKKIIVKKSGISLDKAVGELTIAIALNLLRKINNHDQNLKRGKWKKEMGNLLYGKTVGIIGYGKVGIYVSKLFKSFGANILINDIKKIKKKVKLNKLLLKSDIISIHTNFIKGNDYLLDRRRLKLLKKESILINTSRPEVIDYNYLYILLKKKKIKAAGLDVFNNEPYKGKFAKLSNVLLTPHIGSYAEEIRNQMEHEAIESIIKN